ncbi:hypothetical protein AAJ76_1580001847 [Vairimorpha ceranae]|uniref:Uncharacterized protein n=1 Tax=Vairimorpha ceranae TaxID=40302 RepID=A0A0F9WLK9_9MICR|nr:hypothetical protein AAJ76_1580001847 [Vairimorpha ceranae]KKO73963.1 hypothetical protein AAJ76_1580001847 [Vairimorpha ceranae]
MMPIIFEPSGPSKLIFFFRQKNITLCNWRVQKILSKAKSNLFKLMHFL